MRIPSASTDRKVMFVAVDATDLKTRETGLTGFVVYRSRDGGAPVLYTTPTVTEASAANMPGAYWLTLDEDTTIGATHDTEEYAVHITHASMAPVTRVVELYRPETTEGQTLTIAAGVLAATSGAVAYFDRIADHVWRRTYANVRASSFGDAFVFRSPAGMLAQFVNKLGNIAAGILPVYHEDDSTVFQNLTISTDPTAAPVIGRDP